MNEQQLSELRAWSAGVCGHYFPPNGNKVLEVSDGWMIEKGRWLPDQNDAQALEVKAAVLALMKARNPILGSTPAAIFQLSEYGTGGYGAFFYVRIDPVSRTANSAALAITVAAKAAWDAMKGGEHAEHE